MSASDFSAVCQLSARSVLFLRNYKSRPQARIEVESEKFACGTLESFSVGLLSTNHEQASFSLAVPGPLGGGRVFYSPTVRWKSTDGATQGHLQWPGDVYSKVIRYANRSCNSLTVNTSARFSGMSDVFKTLTSSRSRLRNEWKRPFSSWS